MNNFVLRYHWLILLSLALAACRPVATTAGSDSAQLSVLAAESFLADIAQNVAGERVKVETLMPAGLDPHAFEPTPQDVAKVVDSQVLIVNGAGLESWLQDVLDHAGGQRRVIEASAGLQSRTASEGETADAHEGDPHFWLDPNLVIHYVENIRDGLIAADPEGKDIYTQNAETYIAQLKDLDHWTKQQVEQIPAEKRMMVTNHESFGYFADRYGFKIIGTIIPGVSTGSAPSAQQLAQLIDHIKETRANAIFLETGANPQLAEQVAGETGVKVVIDLYTHSITDAGGQASSYIDMIKHNVQVIVEALK